MTPVERSTLIIRIPAFCDACVKCIICLYPIYQIYVQDVIISFWFWLFLFLFLFLEITGVEPSSGSLVGGTHVTITGNYFYELAHTAIHIGGMGNVEHHFHDFFLFWKYDVKAGMNPGFWWILDGLYLNNYLSIHIEETF